MYLTGLAIVLSIALYLECKQNKELEPSKVRSK